MVDVGDKLNGVFLTVFEKRARRLTVERPTSRKEREKWGTHSWGGLEVVHPPINNYCRLAASNLISIVAWCCLTVCDGAQCYLWAQEHWIRRLSSAMCLECLGPFLCSVVNREDHDAVMI
jgi:hypothetical protein